MLLVPDEGLAEVQAALFEYRRVVAHVGVAAPNVEATIGLQHAGEVAEPGKQEAVEAVKDLDLSAYGVVVIDSITHLWEACKNAFAGRPTKIGTIPLHAWGAI